MPVRPWDQPGVELPAPLIPLERTFEGFLDLEWVELTEDPAHARLQIRENLKQPLGLLHGGIYSAVAETLASVGTVYGVWKDGYTGAGMSNFASFLRPVFGGTLEAVCTCRGRDKDRWIGTPTSPTSRTGSARSSRSPSPCGRSRRPKAEPRRRRAWDVMTEPATQPIPPMPSGEMIETFRRSATSRSTS